MTQFDFSYQSTTDSSKLSTAYLINFGSSTTRALCSLLGLVLIVLYPSFFRRLYGQRAAFKKRFTQPNNSGIRMDFQKNQRGRTKNVSRRVILILSLYSILPGSAAFENRGRAILTPTEPMMEPRTVLRDMPDDCFVVFMNQISFRIQTCRIRLTSASNEPFSLCH